MAVPAASRFQVNVSRPSALEFSAMVKGGPTPAEFRVIADGSLVFTRTIEGGSGISHVRLPMPANVSWVELQTASSGPSRTAHDATALWILPRLVIDEAPQVTMTPPVRTSAAVRPAGPAL